jgi:hypothetical protein
MSVGCAGFAAALAGFAAAATRSAARTQGGMVADQPISVCLVGAALSDAVGPAFAHLTGPAAAGGASVRLWDCRETGIPAPAAPGDADWALAGEGWRVSGHGAGRYLCEARPSGQLWLDRQEARLVGCLADARGLGCADRARPLQRMMSELCRSLGIQEIHAAMVARCGCGVLIVGSGGRGKTTASLDGLHGGLDFLGDDSIGLGDGGDGMPRGHCLYASARVMPRQHARWPRFGGQWHFAAPPEEKALLLPALCCPGRVVASARIVAIALPAVTGGALRVSPVAPLVAFQALVHDSRANRRFGLSAAEFARFGRLTRSVPCYRVEVDASAARVADGLRHLIDAAPALQPHAA